LVQQRFSPELINNLSNQFIIKVLENFATLSRIIGYPEQGVVNRVFPGMEKI